MKRISSKGVCLKENLLQQEPQKAKKRRTRIASSSSTSTAWKLNYLGWVARLCEKKQPLNGMFGEKSINRGSSTTIVSTSNDIIIYYHHLKQQKREKKSTTTITTKVCRPKSGSLNRPKSRCADLKGQVTNLSISYFSQAT